MRLAPRRLELPAPHGRLDALLQEPEAPRFAAVVCHPHPLFGGTMDNNVVYRIARALHDAGGCALRFNFRGVGRSTGTYGGGTAEEDDVRAALDALEVAHPGLPLWVAGFSFGSRVGLAVGAREARVKRLFGVGLALSMFDFSFLETCSKPKAFVQGALDEFGGRETIEAQVGRMPEPKQLLVVDEAPHLFTGKLVELERAAAESVSFLANAS